MNNNLHHKYSVTLADVLGGLFPEQKLASHYIYGISLDSRQVSQGYMFVACVGDAMDGREFIKEAVLNGASVILYEDAPCSDLVKQSLHFARKNGVLTFAIEHCKDIVGDIASKFYMLPSHQMSVVGVTGTNGKTSCVNIIAEALTKANKLSGVIGTLGWGFPDSLQVNALTTPDPVRLQYYCSVLRDKGAESLIFEVSSHALAQKRILGMQVDIGVFTNLTREHLDYHKNIEDYANAKLSLFLHYGINRAVVNLDDDYSQTIISKLPENVDVFCVASSYKHCDYNLCYAENIIVDKSGVRFTVCSPWGKFDLASLLHGEFQINNLLLSLVVLVLNGVPFYYACELLQKITCIKGRAQIFGGDDKPLVIVDYAHTPDALGRILQYARSITKGKVISVFGCGGDRDRGKRPQMGKIAEQLSDEVILTNDNPRNESSKQITDDILKGVSCSWAVQVESDRSLAIQIALSNASQEDIVVVAGKGHEKIQVVAGEYLFHSDIEHVENRLKVWQKKTISCE